MQNVNSTIAEIKSKYLGKIDQIDLEILISHAIGKSREFVLANPKWAVTSNQQLVISRLVRRRLCNEPIAYIIGHKEFYGLNFEVNKSTLIPRPETELIIDLVTQNLEHKCHSREGGNLDSGPASTSLERGESESRITIVDVGTGSGNIIISIASQLKNKGLIIKNYDLYGIDISKKALEIAKNNAKRHKVDDKITFLKGDLLKPLIKNGSRISDFSSAHSSQEKSTFRDDTHLIITANLPYLSNKIYSESPDDVRKYEPKTALHSDNDGLAHYEKLLKQITEALVSCHLSHVTCYFEISPEQKPKLDKVIKIIFPKARIKFHKDLARKWRICEIKI